MNDIPLDVIAKGRGLDDVLEKAMEFFDNAKKVATELGRKTEDEIFSDALMGAAYRLYLLGVQGGMEVLTNE